MDFSKYFRTHTDVWRASEPRITMFFKGLLWGSLLHRNGKASLLHFLASAWSLKNKSSRLLAALSSRLDQLIRPPGSPTTTTTTTTVCLFAPPSRTMLAESLRTLLSLTSEVIHSLCGAASRRLTGSLQIKCWTYRCEQRSHLLAAVVLHLHTAGWAVVFVSAGSWAFIQRANGRRLLLLTRCSPPRLYNCLEYINSSCRARPFLIDSSLLRWHGSDVVPSTNPRSGECKGRSYAGN